MVGRPLYDTIGRRYTATRGPDPRIAQAISEELGDARSVVNVGAGTGAYEPTDRHVIAVEPSPVMIDQRSHDAVPALRANAEALPLDDDSVDVAMAVLSDHHWHDRLAGLRELKRVARRRVLVFNADPAAAECFWLTRDYLPGFARLIPERYRAPGYWAAELARELGALRIRVVPIPHDCRDGFYGAFWRRPSAYLEAAVRDGISVFARLPARELEEALARLRSDLETGAWHHRHADLLQLDDLDLGYRIVVADL